MLLRLGFGLPRVSLFRSVERSGGYFSSWYIAGEPTTVDIAVAVSHLQPYNICGMFPRMHSRSLDWYYPVFRSLDAHC